MDSSSGEGGDGMPDGSYRGMFCAFWALNAILHGFSRTGRHWPTSTHPHGFVGGPAQYIFPLSVCESFLQLAIIESWRCEPVGVCSFDVAFARLLARLRTPPHGVETEHSRWIPPTTILCQNRTTPIFGPAQGQGLQIAEPWKGA